MRELSNTNTNTLCVFERTSAGRRTENWSHVPGRSVPRHARLPWTVSHTVAGAGPGLSSNAT